MQAPHLHEAWKKDETFQYMFCVRASMQTLSSFVTRVCHSKPAMVFRAVS